MDAVVFNVEARLKPSASVLAATALEAREAFPLLVSRNDTAPLTAIENFATTTVAVSE